jgi:hypothetical protein
VAALQAHKMAAARHGSGSAHSSAKVCAAWLHETALIDCFPPSSVHASAAVQPQQPQRHAARANPHPRSPTPRTQAQQDAVAGQRRPHGHWQGELIRAQTLGTRPTLLERESTTAATASAAAASRCCFTSTSAASRRLAQHCAFPECGQLDFLPFECACGATFCLEHRQPVAHGCRLAAAGDYRQVIVYPLCAQVQRARGGAAVQWCMLLQALHAVARAEPAGQSAPSPLVTLALRHPIPRLTSSPCYLTSSDPTDRPGRGAGPQRRPQRRV